MIPFLKDSGEKQIHQDNTDWWLPKGVKMREYQEIVKVHRTYSGVWNSLEMIVQLCEYADKWTSLGCIFQNGHIVYFVKYSSGALSLKDTDHTKP